MRRICWRSIFFAIQFSSRTGELILVVAYTDKSYSGMSKFEIRIPGPMGFGVSSLILQRERWAITVCFLYPVKNVTEETQKRWSKFALDNNEPLIFQGRKDLLVELVVGGKNELLIWSSHVAIEAFPWDCPWKPFLGPLPMPNYDNNIQLLL